MQRNHPFDHSRRTANLTAAIIPALVVTLIASLVFAGLHTLLHRTHEHTSITFYPDAAPADAPQPAPAAYQLRQIAWKAQAIPVPPVAQFRHNDGVAENDLSITPGAINGLTKDQLCAPSFRTGTIRDVTHSMKLRVCAEYGIARADCTGANYEIDHLISLELGGSNDITNLWPEAYTPKPGAREKDVVEDYLHREVCTGAMTLPQAQLAISTDWYEVYIETNAPTGKVWTGQ